MTRWWPHTPGVPAAGHVTAKGFWHPGNGHTCSRCNPEPPPAPPTPPDRRKDPR